MKQQKYVVKSGGIEGDDGGVLYYRGDIRDLSIKAKRRLAELHSQVPDMDWERAESILKREGFL